MTEKPAYAPGCFGSAIFFNGDGVCAKCVYAGECKPAHLEAQRQLREALGVKMKPKRETDALPAKVQEIFDKLDVSADEVRETMLANRNPFSLKAGFMGLICQSLIAYRIIERGLLERVLESKRGVNAETAYYYVRSGVQILQHCGVVATNKNTVRLLGPDDK